MLDKFIAAVAAVSRLCGLVAAAFIFVAVLVICQMVFVRYALNYATIWQTEFVTYSLIAATFIGCPYVLLHRGHVNVDLLPLHLGPRGRYWLALVAALTSLAFTLLLAILGCAWWEEAWSKGWASDSIWRVRLWIPYSAMPIGMALLSLQYLAEILGLLTGRAAPFGIAAEDRR
ncbi:MAG TPA: TRAP transporter small permease [Stellaceae bacterium]|nr:TRAP transporter small permease [Stellaceae bacterium]